MKPYLGVCLVLVTIAVLAVATLYSCASLASHTVDHIRDAFAQVLQVQPQVTINSRVVLTQTAPIAELAVVTKEELVTLDYTQHLEVLSYQVPLTEKKLEVEATYRIKAGFDLPSAPSMLKSMPSPTISKPICPRPRSSLLSKWAISPITGKTPRSIG